MNTFFNFSALTIRFILSIIFISLLLFNTISCTPKDGVIINSGRLGTTTAKLHNSLDQYIVESDVAFKNNNFVLLENISLKYLSAIDDNKSILAIYIKNLLSYIYTFKQIDIEKAFSLCEKLYSLLNNRISKYGPENLKFSSEIDVVSEVSTGGKFLGVLGGSCVLCISPLAVTIDGAEGAKRAGDAAGKAFALTQEQKEKGQLNSSFIKKFFRCDTKAILINVIERLIYLNGVIGDEDEKIKWNDILDQHLLEIYRQTPVRLFETTEEIGRDAVYIKFANGVVKDTRTGLMWIAGPDTDTNWYEARAWVKSITLNGASWRMPTIDELRSLYYRSTGDRIITPLLNRTVNRTVNTSGSESFEIWTDEENEFLEVKAFNTYIKHGSWFTRDFAKRARAFAVFSPKRNN